MVGGAFKVRVDTTKCVGAGRCVAQAPTVFDQSEEDGTVVLLTDSPDAALRQAVEKAARLCPAGAITLADA
ncbi:MAG: ferredoxin [Alphaproteobacteria bacterium]|nr:ferredoxin [Alphaproteobacteria bacterium]